MVSIHRPSKNFLKCVQCRNDHAACRAHKSNIECQRCFKKGLPCGSRTKSNGKEPKRAEAPEFYETIRTSEIFLNLMREQISNILDIVNPRVQYVDHNHSSPHSNSSRILQEFFSCFAARLDGQMTALQKLSQKFRRCMQPVVPSEYSSRLYEDLRFYPGKATAKVSSANATAISHSVEYVEWEEASYRQTFDSPDEQDARLGNYRQAASNLRSLLGHPCFMLDPALEALINRANAVPASHIAYWNKDPHAAIHLWRGEQQCCDLLGRTFPQIVAENGDLNILTEVAQQHLKCLDHTVLDFRGLSLLSVTVCKGFTDCFEFMMNENPYEIKISILHQQDMKQDGCFAPKLLEFAFASRNEYLVRRVYDQDCSMRPYVRHAQLAIELGRGDIASLFLPSLGEAYLTSQDDVNMLEKYAREQMDEISNILAKCLVASPEEVCILEMKRMQMQNFVDNLPQRMRQVDVAEAMASVRNLP